MLESSEPQKFGVIKGPASEPNFLRDSYEPVSCDFTDELENFSVRKIPVEVAYWENRREPKSSRGIITDVFTSAKKEEFLKLDSGKTIRLDLISEIRPLRAA